MNSAWRITVLFALLLTSGGVYVNTAVAETEEQVVTIAFCCGLPNGFSLLHYDSLRSVYTAVAGSLYTFYYPLSEEPEPILADGPPEVALDNKTITVTLKDGLKFGNGHKLTSEDVTFTYNTYLTRLINVNDDFFTDDDFDGWFSSNTSIVALDEKTIQFEFIKPFYGNIEALTIPILEKARYVDRYNDCVTAVDIDKIDLSNENDFLASACNWDGAVPLDGAFVHSAGPYMIDKLTVDENGFFSGIEFIRNPHYFAPETPYADRVKALFFPDREDGGVAIANQKFLQGEIDAFFSNFFYPINPFNLENGTDYKVSRDLSDNVLEIFLNHLHPHFGTGESIPNEGNAALLTNEHQAKLLRKAILLSINRTEMIFPFQDQFQWDAFVAKTSTQESVPATNGSLQPYPYDLELAKSLMEQAGYNFSTIIDSNGDGDYGDEGDTTFFNTTLMTPYDRAGPRLNASLISIDALSKIGIGVSHDFNHTFIEMLLRTYYRGFTPDNGTLTPLYDEGGYDMATFFYETDSQFFDFGDRYSIDRMCDQVGVYCENFAQYSNPILDALSNLHDDTLDLDERKKLLLQIEAILYENVPSIPLVYLSRFGMHKIELDGFDSIMLNKKHIDWRYIKKEGWRRGPADEVEQFSVSPILIGGVAVLVVAVVLAKRRGVF